MPEDVLPVLDVLPKARELWNYVLARHTQDKLTTGLAVEPNGSAAVRVLGGIQNKQPGESADARTKIDISILTVSRSNPKQQSVSLTGPQGAGQPEVRGHEAGGEARARPASRCTMHLIWPCSMEPQRDGREPRTKLSETHSSSSLRIRSQRSVSIRHGSARPEGRKGATPGERRTIHQSGLQLCHTNRSRTICVDR